MVLGAIFLFINIKPYFLFALLPGSLIWMYYYRIQRIRNRFFRAMIIPLVVVVLLSLVLLVFQALGSYLGEYSLDLVLQKAVKTQQDLVREQYGENSYDIGTFDANIWSVLGKLPVALNLALFMPYIWNATNPMMVLTGLENLFLLGFTLFILLNVRPSVLFNSFQNHPLLVFSMLFALFFAFSVGLTTANYGALSRLKIPCIPFYLSSLFMLYELNRKSIRRKSPSTPFLRPQNSGA